MWARGKRNEMVVNGGMVAVKPRWSSRFWVTNAGMIHMYEKDRK